MEVQEYKHDPESNFECLVQQVEEQSEFCDVTVTIGDWRKRFHRCVLTASLLFRSIIETQIADPKTGNYDGKTDRIQDTEIEIKINVSPDVVEMAVMCMYGKIPEFTIANIGDLLELAEYLKIKELQDACVDWFDSVDYSDINCIYVMQLSKKYDFEISVCIEYIESHIPETFQHSDAADLPSNLVLRLFTDERFSYVQTDDKLNFLLKLANNYPSESTKDFVIKLFKTLDLSEVTPSTWETAKADVMFNKIINLETKVRETDQESSRKCVLIMSSNDYFVGLDLQNDRWYRLNSSYYDQYPYEELFGEIAGVRNDNPEVYFKERDFGDDNLITVDLESDEIHRYLPLVEFDDVPNGDLVDVDITHINITNDTVVAIVKNTIEIYEESCSSDSETECVCSNREEEYQSDINDVRQSQFSPENIPDTSASDVSCVMNTPGLSINEQSSSSASSSRSSSISGNKREDKINCTSLYVGKTSDEYVEMRSLFTFRKENITQICMNNQSVLALLTKSDKHLHVILYDLVECKMDRVLSLSVHKDKYEICPTKHGFLLHNDTCCYCFTKAATPIFSGNYKVEKFMLENREEWMVRYLFKCGVWIRVLRRSVHNDIELQYIFHEELADYHSSIDVTWRNVSMPKDKGLFDKIVNLKNIFIVLLSKSKLRCNIECPHCKFSDESDFY